MFSHVDAILFDLDGTLIDSVPDIAVAIDLNVLHFIFIQLKVFANSFGKFKT